MEQEDQIESSKGLDVETVSVLRDRLHKSHQLDSDHFTCTYNTDLNIGIIVSKYIWIYNNKNIYFEILPPPAISKPNINDVSVLNVDSDAYLLIFHNQTIYCRLIDNNPDTRYLYYEMKSLNPEESISCHKLITKGDDLVPQFIIGTSETRLIAVQISISESKFSVNENLIEAPRRFFSPLTKLFTGGDVAETRFKSIQSFKIDRNNTWIVWFGLTTCQTWILSSAGNKLWRLNIENIFKKNNNETDEIKSFEIIGEELIDSDKPSDKILNIVIKLHINPSENLKNVYISYYILRMFIDTSAQHYEAYMPVKLFDEKYSESNDLTKCIICSNESDTSYVFICYQNKTKWLSIFSHEYTETSIEARILGHGVMIDKVRNCLLFIDNEILSFSLLREQCFEQLMRYYLSEIEENWARRQKIQEANFQSMAVDSESDYEKQILDLLKTYADYQPSNSAGGLYDTPQNELLKIKNNQGDEGFTNTLKSLMHKFTEELIPDNMVCSVSREDVHSNKYRSDDSGIIKWWLNTKITRLKSFSDFLKACDIDFTQELTEAEEKLTFAKSIRDNYDDLHGEHLDGITALDIVNSTIQKVVKDYHNISKHEIKRTGATSAQIFYSYPLQLSDKFIYELCKLLYEKNSIGLREDTLFEISTFLINLVKSIHDHRSSKEKVRSAHILWTMDLNLMIDPLKRVLDLMPEMIDNNDSSKLIQSMFDLSRLILLELSSAVEIAYDNDDPNYEEHVRIFEFSRNKLITQIEPFYSKWALALAVEFKDIINSTRIWVINGHYEGIYECLHNFKGSELDSKIFESMHWIVNTTKEQLRTRDAPTMMKLFEVYEENYDKELLRFIEQHYANLKFIYSMRKGLIDRIAKADYKLVYENENNPTINERVKPVVQACQVFNDRPVLF